ncbi:MAG: hypothetical protein JEY94_19060 [Melioribacteraceae bacterium]|nr:hypothetical protein [Melioribacteraceae bacterium]
MKFKLCVYLVFIFLLSTTAQDKKEVTLSSSIDQFNELYVCKHSIVVVDKKNESYVFFDNNGKRKKELQNRNQLKPYKPILSKSGDFCGLIFKKTDDIHLIDIRDGNGNPIAEFDNVKASNYLISNNNKFLITSRYSEINGMGNFRAFNIELGNEIDIPLPKNNEMFFAEFLSDNICVLIINQQLNIKKFNMNKRPRINQESKQIKEIIHKPSKIYLIDLENKIILSEKEIFTQDGDPVWMANTCYNPVKVSNDKIILVGKIKPQHSLTSILPFYLMVLNSNLECENENSLEEKDSNIYGVINFVSSDDDIFYIYHYQFESAKISKIKNELELEEIVNFNGNKKGFWPLINLNDSLNEYRLSFKRSNELYRINAKSKEVIKSKLTKKIQCYDNEIVNVIEENGKKIIR